LKKKHPPVAVVLEPSVAELYSSLREEDKFKNSIDRALDVLKEESLRIKARPRMEALLYSDRR